MYHVIVRMFNEAGEYDEETYLLDKLDDLGDVISHCTDRWNVVRITVDIAIPQ